MINFEDVHVVGYHLSVDWHVFQGQLCSGLDIRMHGVIGEVVLCALVRFYLRHYKHRFMSSISFELHPGLR